MIIKTDTHIILTPFQEEFFKELYIVLGVAIIGGIAGFFLQNPDHKGIAWGFAIAGLMYIFWYFLFRFHLSIIFDTIHSTIYKKNFWIQRKILLFSEATITRESNNHGDVSYHLAHKDDRYRSLQQISKYLNEKEIKAFEENILSEILPLLDGNIHKMASASIMMKP